MTERSEGTIVSENGRPGRPASVSREMLVETSPAPNSTPGIALEEIGRVLVVSRGRLERETQEKGSETTPVLDEAGDRGVSEKGPRDRRRRLT